MSKHHTLWRIRNTGTVKLFKNKHAIVNKRVIHNHYLKMLLAKFEVNQLSHGSDYDNNPNDFYIISMNVSQIKYIKCYWLVKLNTNEIKTLVVVPFFYDLRAFAIFFIIFFFIFSLILTTKQSHFILSVSVGHVAKVL